jgi:excisionase family DNA binding protein
VAARSLTVAREGERTKNWEYFMAANHPDFSGHSMGEHLEALAVSPREACRLLAVGNTRLYELLAAGELESYLDGRMRRVTTRSIRARIARLLVGEGATGAAAAVVTPRRRGRPRKTPESETRGQQAIPDANASAR